MANIVSPVKQLPRSTNGWSVDSREPGLLYFDDPVTKIDKVKGEKQKLLAKHGISTIGDLLGVEDADIK